MNVSKFNSSECGLVTRATAASIQVARQGCRRHEASQDVQKQVRDGTDLITGG